MPHNSENSKYTDQETDTSYPDWDGVTPIDMRAWYRKLPKRLRRRDSRYRTLWEMGFVLSKDTVLAPSRKHALALKDSDVASHTFENPITEEILEPSSDEDEDEDEDLRALLGPKLEVNLIVCKEVNRLLATATQHNE